MIRGCSLTLCVHSGGYYRLLAIPGICRVNCKGNENKDLGSCPSGNLCLREFLLLTAQRNVPAYFPFLSILWASRIDCILFSFYPGKVRLPTSWIFAFPEDSPITGWHAWSVYAHCWPWSHKALNIPLYSIRCKSSPPHIDASRMPVISPFFSCDGRRADLCCGQSQRLYSLSDLGIWVWLINHRISLPFSS